MAKELEIRCFISIDGAPEVPWESLDKQKQQEIGKRLAGRMAKAAEDYYSAHPKEFAARLAAKAV